LSPRRVLAQQISSNADVSYRFCRGTPEIGWLFVIRYLSESSEYLTIHFISYNLGRDVRVSEADEVQSVVILQLVHSLLKKNQIQLSDQICVLGNLSGFSCSLVKCINGYRHSHVYKILCLYISDKPKHVTMSMYSTCSEISSVNHHCPVMSLAQQEYLLNADVRIVSVMIPL